MAVFPEGESGGEFGVGTVERVAHNLLAARAVTDDAETDLGVGAQRRLRQRQPANAGSDLSEEFAAGTHGSGSMLLRNKRTVASRPLLKFSS